MNPEPVHILTLFALGASMGMTACVATCLPFMGTWLVGRGGAARVGREMAAFIGGRVLAYSALGLVAALAGQGLTVALKGGMGAVAIGLAGIAAGLWLWRAAPRPQAVVQPLRFQPPGAAAEPAPGGCHTRRADLPPFAMGFALAMTPCLPLTTLLAAAAQAGSPWQGAAHGLAFGLGAALTPLWLAGALVHALGRRFSGGQAALVFHLTRFSALLLMALGLRRIASVFL